MASAYNPSQLQHYLNHINLPTYLHPPSHPADLTLLFTLHTHHVTTIPYENLSLHYCPSSTSSSQQHRAPSLDPQYLFEKIVTRKAGRGGYCMENCIFFHHVLKACGFSVYMAGARVRLRDTKTGVPGGDYIGWVHVVNIVTLQPSGAKYAVDVSFGGDGPIHPLPLIDGHITPNLGTQQLRLIHVPFPYGVQSSSSTSPFSSSSSIPPSSSSQSQTPSAPALALANHDSPPKFWIYQYRNNPDRDWNSFYAFPELEFMEPDLGMMNFWAGASPDSFQTLTVLVVKFLLGDNAGEGSEASVVIGKVMLVDGTVKRNMGGKTEIVRVCESEEERVSVLREVFGIVLSEEEKMGIRGWRTELGGVRI